MYIETFQYKRTFENYLLSFLKELGSCCFKKHRWIWSSWRLHFFHVSCTIVVGYILVNLVRHRSVHLTSESSVYHPIRTLRARDPFESGVGRVEGSGVEEGVVNTLLDLKAWKRPFQDSLLISLLSKTRHGNKHTQNVRRVKN